MTFERRCTIEPGDIIGLQLECRKCGSFLRIPATKVNNESMAQLATSSCSQCHTAYGFSYDTNELQNFMVFTSAIAHLNETMHGRNLLLKLEIRDEAKP